MRSDLHLDLLEDELLHRPDLQHEITQLFLEMPGSYRSVTMLDAIIHCSKRDNAAILLAIGRYAENPSVQKHMYTFVNHVPHEALKDVIPQILLFVLSSQEKREKYGVYFSWDGARLIPYSP